MLEVRDLRVHYGAVEAVKGVSFQINAGEIISLIGANGAGKSTILRALTGLVRPSSGTIEFHGQSLVGLAPHQIIRLGIGHVPEGRRLFPKMSVMENLKMGAYLRKKKAEIEETLEMVYEHFPILKERTKQRAGSLSGGEQQMLAVARILRTGAHLLLLDEISEGLAPVIVNKLAEMIRTLKAKGYTIVMVEQNFRFAAPLADRFYVMEHGTIVESFPAAQLRAKEDTLHELLGV